MTYQEADAKLKGRLRVGTRQRATYLVRNSGVPGDSIHLKYHNTYVVTWYADGCVTINSGGWRTVTTKSRINEYVPEIAVTQKNFEWFVMPQGKLTGVSAYWDRASQVPFKDNLLVLPIQEETDA